jgi:uncharacterized protein YcfL
MKKLFILIAAGLMFSACGGGGGNADNKNDSVTVSPELQQINKEAGDISTKSKELNQKADSILNNI